MFTIKQLSEATGVSVEMIRKMATDGVIPSVQEPDPHVPAGFRYQLQGDLNEVAARIPTLLESYPRAKANYERDREPVSGDDVLKGLTDDFISIADLSRKLKVKHQQTINSYVNRHKIRTFTIRSVNCVSRQDAAKIAHFYAAKSTVPAPPVQSAEIQHRLDRIEKVLDAIAAAWGIKI